MATLSGIAEFDEGRTYRYCLRRFLVAPDPLIELDLDKRAAALFIMLNPSIADDEDDDPTVSACKDFVRLWGLEDLVIVNLFARVGTDPRSLIGRPDIVGPKNDAYLEKEIRRANMVVCAWGQNASKIDPTRAPKVKAMVRALAPGKSFALHVNQDGSPKHPLYIKRTTKVVPFP